jgi:hypothetical protein
MIDIVYIGAIVTLLRATRAFAAGCDKLGSGQ